MLNNVIINLFKKIDCELYIKLFIVAIVVFSLGTYEAYDEVFYWFSGATSYTFPLSLAILGIVLYINYEKSDFKKKSFMILSLIFGFLAMGGTLMVSGMGCYVVLLICVYSFIKNHTIYKRNVIMLFVWVGGALINSIAPGNYVRHGVIDQSGIHPIDALKYAIKAVAYRGIHFLRETNYICIIVLIVLCGMLIEKKVSATLKEYTIVSLLGMLTPVVTAFPASLGYSSVFLPNRCNFLVDFSLILSLTNLFLVVGIELSRNLKKLNKKVAIFLFIVAFCCLPINDFSIFKTATVNISRQIINNTYSDYYNVCSAFYEMLEKHKGEDVRISSSEFPYSIGYFHNFILTEDPSNWVNTSVASYYGLKSIAVY